MDHADELRRMLAVAETASPVDAVESVTSELGRDLDASSISLLIADLSGRALVRLAHVPLDTPVDTEPGVAGDRRRTDRDVATTLPFDGGPREQVMRDQRTRVVEPGSTVDGGTRTWTVLAPVTERGEAIGLLEVVLPAEPGERAVTAIGHAAHLLGLVVIASRRHTDLFEWGQRSRPFTLSAEIQRRLLPAAFTCEAAAFTLSAWLEPAASVGGDTFDYSVARDVLHLSITDAMGHGVASALTATLCLGALRSGRRRGLSLVEQVQAANAALVEHSASVDGETFVTGLFGRLDLTSGDLALVNAGHVAPYLARNGAVTTLPTADGLPLGLFPVPEVTYEAATVGLRAGDRLVLVTDGIVERNAASFALAQGIADTRPLHPRDAVRRLADAILEVTGHDLSDDATLLILDWHGDHPGDQDTTSHVRDPENRPTRAPAPF